MHDIYLELTTIFREVFDDDNLILSPELTADDVDGWDSFKHIDVLILVQTRFGIQLTSREIDNVQCVGDLARLIERRRAAKTLP